MTPTEKEIAKKPASHYSGIVDKNLDQLSPITGEIQTIEELRSFVELRKDKHLSSETFSIEHSGYDIDGENDSLLYRIAQKAFDMEKKRGGKFRVFEPVLTMTPNKHKYGREWVLNVLGVDS